MWFLFEHVDQFLVANEISATFVGEVFGPFRKTLVFPGAFAAGILERNGPFGHDWTAEVLVDPVRVDRMERDGHLTAAEAEDIRRNGYIATYLENIERNRGYKGFNRPGIDSVLRALDPRSSVRLTALDKGTVARA